MLRGAVDRRGLKSSFRIGWNSKKGKINIFGENIVLSALKISLMLTQIKIDTALRILKCKVFATDD
jgi:hypothetical protein